MLNPTNSKKDIIVFSHLRWDSSPRRPQHLMQKMAKGRRILFIEEPIIQVSSKSPAKIIKISRNIRVVQPNVSKSDFLVKLPKIIDNQSKKWGMDSEPVLWFFNPLFKDLINYVNHSLVIFDSVKPTLPKNSTLSKMENELTAMADIILTQTKDNVSNHKNEYVYAPNSVDRYHFDKVIGKNTETPEDIKAIKPFILGFYGTIDKSIDFELLSGLCKNTPQFSVVLLGKLNGISADTLPKFDNFHYLGEKSYEQIPHYLKKFDIAILPYKQNKENKSLNVGKVLEYISGRKRIISTSTKNLPQDCATVMMVATTADGFLDCVNSYISEQFSKKVHREFLQDSIVRYNSWEKLANQMEEVIIQAVNKNKVGVGSYSREMV